MRRQRTIILSLPGALNIKMTDEDIDDIMESAMYGCTYWCDRAVPDGPYLGEYASEQISHDGALLFYPIEEDDYESARLTRKKFRYGVYNWLKSLKNIQPVISDGCLDPGQIDAGMADTILQYALFGEVRYA